MLLPTIPRRVVRRGSVPDSNLPMGMLSAFEPVPAQIPPQTLPIVGPSPEENLAAQMEKIRLWSSIGELARVGTNGSAYVPNYLLTHPSSSGTCRSSSRGVRDPSVTILSLPGPWSRDVAHGRRHPGWCAEPVNLEIECDDSENLHSVRNEARLAGKTLELVLRSEPAENPPPSASAGICGKE